MAVETQSNPEACDASVDRDRASLAQYYRRIRAMSEQIAFPLSAEDCAIQTMADVSPTKWHLAHTTWFFETFLLKQKGRFEPFDSRFEYLFNSYYNGVGKAFPRDRRGQISRPGLEETYRYRQHVDHLILDWIQSNTLSESQRDVLILGLNHEQQHQELMLTDIKHVLFCNPSQPAYQSADAVEAACVAEPLHWRSADETIAEVGYSPTWTDAGQTSFSYDNEGPRHRRLIHSHKIASRSVTNGEYLEFIQAGGYRDASYWLSPGWDAVCQHEWTAPLYWIERDDGFMQYSLAGLVPLRLDDPVCHVSYFEADAYARWAGKRLPTEFEWEVAAEKSLPGNLFADHLLRDGEPVHPCGRASSDFLGNVWEWTASQYSAYPGYAPVAGTLGEYNGKFMCNQFVLRGGSCATSSDHIRTSYRNFFPPETRWQFTGIRLASDLESEFT
ncbi:ergothioneine biosynthesis protein EgtB [Allorhodopirellula solitaria]|uniref:Iron(II)-dependent oxidoreductase EgtB n=1 Tax=Allorhodopirellula solitaria TaxID=2527987 RepID=A0A5C5WLJ4_9BACT|nr:ergothioneine biosynthesis protein EgtB [Allorhodopirellula solitaria]TWT51654.1 Iron(II)-dependent oxidoreductase EgtB [Allorhodopirellula solitaria]